MTLEDSFTKIINSLNLLQDKNWSYLLTTPIDDNTICLQYINDNIFIKKFMPIISNNSSDKYNAIQLYNILFSCCCLANIMAKFINLFNKKGKVSFHIFDADYNFINTDMTTFPNTSSWYENDANGTGEYIGPFLIILKDMESIKTTFRRKRGYIFFNYEFGLDEDKILKENKKYKSLTEIPFEFAFNTPMYKLLNLMPNETVDNYKTMHNTTVGHSTLDKFSDFKYLASLVTPKEK